MALKEIERLQEARVEQEKNNDPEDISIAKKDLPREPTVVSKSSCTNLLYCFFLLSLLRRSSHHRINVKSNMLTNGAGHDNLTV